MDCDQAVPPSNPKQSVYQKEVRYPGNEIEIAEQFRHAIRSAGLEPPAVIKADGKLRRFATNGKRGDDAGWYILHGDGIPAGSFGDWRADINKSWCADIGRPLNPAEESAHRAKVEAMRREREAEEIQRRTDAAIKAAMIWKAAQAAPDDHPYLTRKGIKAHGARLHGGALVIPLHDRSELHSLQFIHADGEKRFLTGGRVAGCYFVIGDPNDATTLCIAEGFATGATIFEATNYPVAVAFNVGNLEPVARALRAKFPDVTMIICADDDVKTEGNPGVTKGRATALAVAGKLAVPDFASNRPDGVTDFNDMAALSGNEAVASAIAAAKDITSVTASSRYDDWPDPKPIRATLQPVPAFDANMLLPAALSRWIIDEADRMPCPPDFIAAAILVSLGAIIGARCAIKPKSRDDWLIVPNVWGGVVGIPSAKKSPAIGVALKPLDRLIVRAVEGHRADLDAFEAEKTIFDAQADAIQQEIKKAAKSTSSSGSNGSALESLGKKFKDHRQQEPAAPTLRRFKTNDTTMEKLGELLRENPAGLLVLRDELVGLIASWDREGREGERAFFLEAWNGCNSFDTDRIGRGSIFIPNHCVSIFGGIQPDKLTGYLEQAVNALANDGMLQRFQVLVYPDYRQWEWRDRSPLRDARDRAFFVFETLADFDPVTWGAFPADDVLKFPHFRFDETAQEIFIEWSAELHRERIKHEDHPIIAQHLVKFDKLFPAVALILHLAECATTGQRGPVTKEAALRAAAWCDYLEAHARRCYGLLMDDGLRAAHALAAKVKQRKLSDGFTARDVRRNQWRYLTTDESIHAALDWLLDEGWLKAEEVGGAGPGTGRRTWRYFINPKALTSSESGGEHDELASTS
jgi:phage/plasmid primase-like uncharacterized protein